MISIANNEALNNLDSCFRRHFVSLLMSQQEMREERDGEQLATEVWSQTQTISDQLIVLQSSPGLRGKGGVSGIIGILIYFLS